MAAAIVPISAASAQDQFLGQIFTTASNFCPVGWAEMKGQLLTIADNGDLYTLIGNTFGGSSAQGNFALPTALPQFTATNIPLHQCIALQGAIPTHP